VLAWDKVAITVSTTLQTDVHTELDARYKLMISSFSHIDSSTSDS